MKLIYGVKDRPKFGQLIVFAIQQLLAIMAATLVVPVIVGNEMQPAAALFGAGIGTLVYLLFTKFRSPVFLGSSFAFLGSMAAAFAGGVSMALGYLGLIIGAVVAGLVYVIIAIVVKFVGVNWINKLMPAVVIGPTVAIIGLSLAGNAVGDLTTGEVTKVVVEQVPAIVDGVPVIRSASDKKKDQSYMLWQLSQEQIERSVFPLAELTKDEIRAICASASLSVASRKDSQDICFVPDGDYASFITKLTNYISVEGNYIDESGKILGTHKGNIHYTVGQRKGLGIALGEPAYVLGKNVSDNTVTLGKNESLFK